MAKRKARVMSGYKDQMVVKKTVCPYDLFLGEVELWLKQDNWAAVLKCILNHKYTLAFSPVYGISGFYDTLVIVMWRLQALECMRRYFQLLNSKSEMEAYKDHRTLFIERDCPANRCFVRHLSPFILDYISRDDDVQLRRLCSVVSIRYDYSICLKNGFANILPLLIRYQAARCYEEIINDTVDLTRAVVDWAHHMSRPNLLLQKSLHRGMVINIPRGDVIVRYIPEPAKTIEDLRNGQTANEVIRVPMKLKDIIHLQNRIGVNRTSISHLKEFKEQIANYTFNRPSLLKEQSLDLTKSFVEERGLNVSRCLDNVLYCFMMPDKRMALWIHKNHLYSIAVSVFAAHHHRTWFCHLRSICRDHANYDADLDTFGSYHSVAFYRCWLAVQAPPPKLDVFNYGDYLACKIGSRMEHETYNRSNNDLCLNIPLWKPVFVRYEHSLFQCRGVLLNVVYCLQNKMGLPNELLDYTLQSIWIELLAECECRAGLPQIRTDSEIYDEL